MNISTFFGLNVGVNALNTAQQVEAVISNNISNANTTGYVQENANLTEYAPFPTLPANDATTGAQLGQGSDVTSVSRETSAFVNQQDRANQGTQANYDTQSQILTQVEGILNEPSSQSMQNSLDQFFSSWQTLATDPSNTAARQAVISQATTLGQTFQTITGELGNLNNSLLGVVTGQIGQLNTDAINVASLNKQIISSQQSGQSANQLLDQRGVLLDNMSKLANISYTELPTGAVTITLGSTSLVDSSGAQHDFPQNTGSTVTALTFDPQTNAPTGITSLSQLGTGASADMNAVTSGSIAGNVASMDNITNVLSQLNNFLSTSSTSSNSLASEVNSIQNAGYGLTGTTHTSGSSIFQTHTDANGNVYLTVNPSLTTSSLAASDKSNQPGNSNNAVNMVNLQTSPTTLQEYNGGTFDQGISSIVSSVGTITAGVIASDTTATALAQQSSNTRQSVSGVSINEQAALMVQYQNSYSAAAKFISVFEAMMTSLLGTVA